MAARPSTPAALASYIFRRRKAWGVNVYAGQRTKVRTGQYKLPDLCIVAGPRPSTAILEEPPLVLTEWLAPLRIPGTPIEIPLARLDEE